MRGATGTEKARTGRGDSLDELQARLPTLRRSRLEDLPMDGTPWRFDYAD